ncbi:flavin-containing monooxygenase [Nocardia terpenica]|uniref:flavin-containing monooxygenase n=1 Tax=Nocardia terpenica TaxID=455432 RepID=UPI00082B067A|nr:NAD(P)/FAD-dependent oxidoreductase [Nocardia terpenica]
MPEVIIIGAGFSGMAAAIKLKRAGIDDFVILERAHEVGGTWRDNTYPGVAVDIPSFTYSYHFEPNAGWSHAFAPGAELFDYAKHCAEKYGLRPHVRFDSEVACARFDEQAHLWRVTSTGGTTVTGRFLISCHGSLITPQRPAIPGLDNFAGHTVYTMRWDHDHDLAGRRVAVIGTGASALQVIPSIADRVSALHVYQRTPIWVLPKVNPRMDGLPRAVLEHVPLAQRSIRWAASIGSEALLTLGAVYYRDAPFIVDGIERLARAFLRSQVPDPDLREKLTPTYGFGCKRPSFSNTYYRTFLRDNVELITTASTGSPRAASAPSTAPNARSTP